MTHEEFLENTRKIVEKLGKESKHSTESGGVPCGQALCYQDRRLTITSDPKSKALDISWFNHDGIYNPIVMVDPRGRAFRFHGEWVQAIPHVSEIIKNF